jgi:polar amino acid transport system substrate-binding protein
MMSGSGIETPERLRFAWFINCMATKNYVIILKGVKASSSSEFLSNRSLLWGAVRSFKHGKYSDAFLDTLETRQQTVSCADLPTLYRLMKANRIQAVFSQPPTYAKYIKDFKLEDQVRIENWFPEEKPVTAGIVLSRKLFSGEEVRKWKTVIEGMRKDGTLKRIYTRYLGESGAEQMLEYPE